MSSALEGVHLPVMLMPTCLQYWVTRSRDNDRFDYKRGKRENRKKAIKFIDFGGNQTSFNTISSHWLCKSARSIVGAWNDSCQVLILINFQLFIDYASQFEHVIISLGKLSVWFSSEPELRNFVKRTLLAFELGIFHFQIVCRW